MLPTQPRILAVDTHRDAVRALAAQLAALGAATGAVADPAEVCASVVRFGPSVVLVSGDLPGHATREVLGALARDPRTLHLPVAVVTARPRGEALLELLRAGAVDYLVYPLRPEVELAALLELAAQHGALGAPFPGTPAERLIAVMRRLKLDCELVTSDPASAARFEHGELAFARCDALSGEAALEALMGLPDLAFRAVASAATPAPPESARPGTVELELEVEVEQVDAPVPLPPRPAPPRCLLVDDEPDLLTLFSAFLTRAGFVVSTAPDGLQGFELCVVQRPDIVVADLNMPHLDGWGLLRRVRTDVRLAETPVVFLSAQDDYRESLRAVNAGAQDYLAKTSKMDVLARRVRAALEPRDAARASVIANREVHGRVEQLGVRWLLGALCGAHRTGTVAFADALGVYNVGLRDGVATFAAAQQGPRRFSGEAALAVLIRLHDGDVQFLPDQLPDTVNLDAAPLPALLERVVVAANQADTDALEALLVRAAAVEVDGSVFALFERFCPPFGREVATFIRAGKTPKQILAESDLNPVEVIATLRDMVRRQVIRLKV